MVAVDILELGRETVGTGGLRFLRTVDVEATLMDDLGRGTEIASELATLRREAIEAVEIGREGPTIFLGRGRRGVVRSSRAGSSCVGTASGGGAAGGGDAGNSEESIDSSSATDSSGTGSRMLGVGVRRPMVLPDGVSLESGLGSTDFLLRTGEVEFVATDILEAVVRTLRMEDADEAVPLGAFLFRTLTRIDCTSVIDSLSLVEGGARGTLLATGLRRSSRGTSMSRFSIR